MVKYKLSTLNQKITPELGRRMISKYDLKYACSTWFSQWSMLVLLCVSRKEAGAPYSYIRAVAFAGFDFASGRCVIVITVNLPSYRTFVWLVLATRPQEWEEYCTCVLCIRAIIEVHSWGRGRQRDFLQDSDAVLGGQFWSGSVHLLCDMTQYCWSVVLFFWFLTLETLWCSVSLYSTVLQFAKAVTDLSSQKNALKKFLSRIFLRATKVCVPMSENQSNSRLGRISKTFKW